MWAGSCNLLIHTVRFMGGGSYCGLGGFTPEDESYFGIEEDLGLRVRGPINDLSAII